MSKIDPVWHERLATLMESMGYEFVGCEQISMGGQTVFRIYIDAEKGVTIDDCSKVSRQVGAMMDVEEGPISGRYALEVSSPGLSRPLFELKHYQKFVGSQVKIQLFVPLNKRRQYKGVLAKVEGEDIHLLLEGAEAEVVVLPFSAIDKAHLIPEIRI